MVSETIDQSTAVRKMNSREGKSPFLSVVVPCYNEAEVVETIYARLYQVVMGLGLQYELVFVNDGSRDTTLPRLVQLADQHPEVKVIDFSRNFGHQVAVTAGMDYASGDVVVLIDADLQDPPELIEAFIQKWREGYDVVYAVRQKRKGETRFKRWTAKWFYRVLYRMTEIQIPVDTGDFRLMDRKVVDSLLSIKERHRFIRGLVSWVGFSQIGIPYERDKRFAGESKYPLKKMIRFALDGITSFSVRPLQWASQLGFISSVCGFVGILVILYLKFFTNETIQGWTSMMVISLFLGGIQLLILGIMGEYIGRIYDEVRNRPLYIVRGKYNVKARYQDLDV